MADEAIIRLIMFSIQLITIFYVVIDICKDHKKSDLDKFIERYKKNNINL